MLYGKYPCRQTSRQKRERKRVREDRHVQKKSVRRKLDRETETEYAAYLEETEALALEARLDELRYCGDLDLFD